MLEGLSQAQMTLPGTPGPNVHTGSILSPCNARSLSCVRPALDRGRFLATTPMANHTLSFALRAMVLAVTGSVVAIDAVVEVWILPLFVLPERGMI